MKKEIILFHLENAKAYAILAKSLRSDGRSSWKYYMKKAQECKALAYSIEPQQGSTYIKLAS